MVIQELVAIEAIRVIKWILAVLVLIAGAAFLLPEILPRLKNADIFGVKFELRVEKSIKQAQREATLRIEAPNQASAVLSQKLIFEGAVKDIQNALSKSPNKLVGSRALWIDDNPSNNNAIRNLMEEAGIVFSIVTKEGIAKKLLDENHYDFVISDNLRDGDDWAGIKFFRSLKKVGDTPPWFFYSGSIGIPKIRNRITQGATYATNNPFELIPAIVASLEKTRPITELEIKTSAFSISVWLYVSVIILVLLCFIALFKILQFSLRKEE